MIDANKNIALLFMILFLFLAPNTNAFAGERQENKPYCFEDFVEQIDLYKENESENALFHTISIATYKDSDVSVQVLLELFPNYVVDREVSADTNSRRYVAYDLDDGSRLFFFVDNDVLTNVCRMEPRCTVDEFLTIKTGVSSPYDVIGIDKNAVFNPFVQWGPVSYHCLDDGTFYRVTYRQLPHSLEEYLVDEIIPIQQNECLTILKDLVYTDMPSRN